MQQIYKALRYMQINTLKILGLLMISSIIFMGDSCNDSEPDVPNPPNDVNLTLVGESGGACLYTGKRMITLPNNKVLFADDYLGGRYLVTIQRYYIDQTGVRVYGSPWNTVFSSNKFSTVFASFCDFGQFAWNPQYAFIKMTLVSEDCRKCCKGICGGGNCGRSVFETVTDTKIIPGTKNYLIKVKFKTCDYCCPADIRCCPPNSACTVQ